MLGGYRGRDHDTDQFAQFQDAGFDPTGDLEDFATDIALQQHRGRPAYVVDIDEVACLASVAVDNERAAGERVFQNFATTLFLCAENGPYTLPNRSATVFMRHEPW